jgi:hypothetical protein
MQPACLIDNKGFSLTNHKNLLLVVDYIKDTFELAIVSIYGNMEQIARLEVLIDYKQIKNYPNEVALAGLAHFKRLNYLLLKLILFYCLSLLHLVGEDSNLVLSLLNIGDSKAADFLVSLDKDRCESDMHGIFYYFTEQVQSKVAKIVPISHFKSQK